MALRDFIFCVLLSFVTVQLQGQASSSEYTLPSNIRDVHCSYQGKDFAMSIAEKYRSSEEVSTYYPAVVGDLDGDGYSEILIPGGTHNASNIIYVFNHKAELIRKIDLPTGLGMRLDYDSVILSDLDNDGKGEIIVTASLGNKLLVYDYEGKLLAQADYPVPFPKTAGVADFNKDGRPEIFAGSRVYSFDRDRGLTLIVDSGNKFYEATVAQDVTGDGVPELVSLNTVYSVDIKSLTNPSLNKIKVKVTCDELASNGSSTLFKTFALADLDLDGSLEVVTVMPVKDGTVDYRLETRIWETSTGKVKYRLNLPILLGSDVANPESRTIKNSWPFIGDTDGNGIPDIVFMGGVNAKGYTSVYRLEYSKEQNDVVERVKNNQFNDFSSMCTSMSMFDFNNDGRNEIVYRDESSLFILDGATLAVEKEIKDCYSGTGWEYPVIASLTPDNESFVIMPSGEKGGAVSGTLRIYGADTANGNKPWMVARKVWYQYSFYQNQINDDLTIIANPAPLNHTLVSKDGTRTLQPFNGHMLQLGMIDPVNLVTVHPAADIVIGEYDFGYDRKADKLILDLKVGNSGAVNVESEVKLNVYTEKPGKETLIGTFLVSEKLGKGETHTVQFSIDDFSNYMPFDKLFVRVGEDILDCDDENNKFIITPEEIGNVLYVKKGEKGTGLSWSKAMGELSEALKKTEERNKKYPNSLSQIWVAKGAYLGNYLMQEAVDVYGGFVGNETKLDQSQPLRYPTIIDAQHEGRPLTQDRIFKELTTWRGFTLQNGRTIDCGGGAYLLEGGVLSHSVVKNNSAAQGGGVCIDNATLMNCIIESNTVVNANTSRGAGVYAVKNSRIINNTIVKNTIQAIIATNSIGATTQAEGIGIYASQSDVYNNIIYGNVANDEVSNLYSDNSTIGANLVSEDDSIDPFFKNYKGGNYQLLPISPALNKGSNSLIANDWTTDLDGVQRIYADRVDQGAMEYQDKELALGKDGSFYVNEKKEGNGSDWENALNNLTDALIGAKLLNEHTPSMVKKIWVASGTYHGNFEMVEGANLHGGFAGYETDFNKIDTVANKTYIDASYEGRALTQSVDFEEPTEWAGVIIQNGYTLGVDEDVYGGGAYLKKNGALCYSTIRGNKAVAISNYNQVNAYGGGVYLAEGASLNQSTVSGNVAQISDESGGKILNGVAQGGGVNNLDNRLTYLVVIDNKTISQTNTDGAAMYSSGDIINSIIANNVGQTAIYLSKENKIINSTIVGNKADHTLYGKTRGTLQNSIVYNNITSETDSYNIDFKENNNLINIDPAFKDGSFQLEYKSQARAIGNAAAFPEDLTEDLANRPRFINLKENVRVIDAGVYQSDIKVVSATETVLEVPFGTTFEDLGLKDGISSILEFGYDIEATVTWDKGSYNELAPGRYTLVGDLSNLINGVVNPDEVQGTIDVVVRLNHVADIEGLTINSEDWLARLDEDYLIDCAYTDRTIPISIDLPYFATISFAPEVQFSKEENTALATPDISKPGFHRLVATVTSQDGKTQRVYPMTLVKYFPFWSIIEQRWNNTLVINNNETTNGGYEFKSYQWYKDGKEIGTKQYYSAGPRKTDLLDEKALYHAKMVDVNGVEYFTCADSPVLMNSGLQVTPNPVKRGGVISITVPLKEGMKGSVSIYSLSGLTAMSNAPLNKEVTEIAAPINPGIYILRISLEGGVSESLRMVVY